MCDRPVGKVAGSGGCGGVRTRHVSRWSGPARVCRRTGL